MKSSVMIKFALVGAATAFVTGVAFADDTLSEKAAEAGRDTKKAARKAGRAIKDETCQMVKGKMECAKDQIKHKTQNVIDEAKDKADDSKL